MMFGIVMSKWGRCHDCSVRYGGSYLTVLTDECMHGVGIINDDLLLSGHVTFAFVVGWCDFQAHNCINENDCTNRME